MRALARSVAVVLAFHVLTTSGQAGNLPTLKVSENSRFLVTETGKPFFYLADTAWELFHRLTREEADRYLTDRASKGFNVIQTVALAERSGLTEPNAYGHIPLIDKTDPTRLAVKPGTRNDYWDHVDEIIDLAAQKGLYVGLLPAWGKYVTSHWANGIVDGIFNVENAQQYGTLIGRRYRDRTNIIWIIGGDRAAPTKESQAIWRAMVKGVAIGVTGSEDYSKVLMTYHTSGPGHASDYFHEDDWLDFTSIQSSHGDRILNWKMIEKDYRRRPIKPVIDLETTYPEVVIIKGMKPGNDDHARRSAYWSVFAGSCGHTYGHNAIWQMHAPGRKPVLNPKSYWYDALNAPSARQMGYLRRLIESRPFLSRVPDQSLIASESGSDIDHLEATKGDGYAFVYSPMGASFQVHLGRTSGEEVKTWWFDPRTGQAKLIGTFANRGQRQFDPPGKPAVGNDWVLVIDDARKAFSPPGDVQNNAQLPPAHAKEPPQKPQEQEWVKVADDNRSFVLEKSGRRFLPWGFNYDHDGPGRLIEDYWDDEWPMIVEDFREMKELGATVVRIHLQFGKFMDRPDEPNQHSLGQLARLVALAEHVGIYLDLTGLGCYHKQDVPPWYDKLDEEDRWAAQAAFWEAVAKTCAASPAIFCYDLMNEPVVGGARKRDDWPGGAFGDKHFVQFIVLETKGRPRHEIARAWTSQLVAAIRKHDRKHLVTIGVVHWSLDRPGLSSGFIPEKIADEIDFIAMHIYPQKGKVDEAMETVRGFAAVGKPVVIEETFPLKCSSDEMSRFIDESKSVASGWISFYWGKTPEECRKGGTMADAIMADWLEVFPKKMTQIQSSSATTPRDVAE